MAEPGLDALLADITKLKAGGAKKTIDKRMSEFRVLGGGNSDEIFSELCFCIMTANFNAERSIKIQDELKDRVCVLPEHELREKLKAFGHRFPEARAKYIAEAQKHKDSIKDLLNNFKNENEAREWLVKNVKGIGYKESSHFLRNIGFTGLAIVDFHIIDLLVRYGLIERPKTLTPKKYLEIEKLLKEIAKKAGLNLAELDLYLWYMETGKILK